MNSVESFLDSHLFWLLQDLLNHRIGMIIAILLALSIVLAVMRTLAIKPIRIPIRNDEDVGVAHSEEDIDASGNAISALNRFINGADEAATYSNLRTIKSHLKTVSRYGVSNPGDRTIVQKAAAFYKLLMRRKFTGSRLAVILLPCIIGFLVYMYFDMRAAVNEMSTEGAWRKDPILTFAFICVVLWFGYIFASRRPLFLLLKDKGQTISGVALSVGSMAAAAMASLSLVEITTTKYFDRPDEVKKDENAGMPFFFIILVLMVFFVPIVVFLGGFWNLLKNYVFYE